MKSINNQAGSVAVEMALVIIPLLILAFGVTEFGRAIFQYNALAKGVRDGARHLSQFAPGDAARIAEARCLATNGTLDCSGPLLAPGMSTSLVAVYDRSSNAGYNLQATGRGTVNLVSVQITGFQFSSMAPAFVPDFEFTPIQATMVQVL